MVYNVHINTGACIKTQESYIRKAGKEEGKHEEENDYHVLSSSHVRESAGRLRHGSSGRCRGGGTAQYTANKRSYFKYGSNRNDGSTNKE